MRQGGFNCKVRKISNTPDSFSFLDINRKIAEGGKEYKPVEPRGPSPKVTNFIATTAKIEKQTVIPAGSIIGAYTTVGERYFTLIPDPYVSFRVGVKKTIIGTHCKIGNNAKVINSVIFDHVTVRASRFF